MNRKFFQLQGNEFLVNVSYPYQAQDMRQLTLRQHEKIKVIQTHESGWWIGENIEGEVGLFPSNYVSQIRSEKADANTPTKRFNKPKEHKPELLKPEFQLKRTKTQLMMDSMGLSNEEFLSDLHKINDLDALLSESDDDSERTSPTSNNKSTVTTASEKEDSVKVSEEMERLKLELDVLRKEKEFAEKRVKSLEIELEQKKVPIANATTLDRTMSSPDVDKFKKQNSFVSEENNDKNKKKFDQLMLLNSQMLSKLPVLQNKLKEMKANQIALRKESVENMTFIKNHMEMLWKSGLNQLVTMLEEVTEKYKKECKIRRQLFNQLQEMNGNIRVYVRIRPILPDETTTGNCLSCNDSEVSVTDLLTKKVSKFEFERVFSPEATQELVFQDVQPLVTSILDGYNVCIFAYGQTGSGKTHTMEGIPSNRGVNYRTLDQLFKVINERKDEYRYEISVAVMEIYNETLVDLLSKDKQKLEVKMAG
jgi:hypothetical protein